MRARPNASNTRFSQAIAEGTGSRSSRTSRRPRTRGATEAGADALLLRGADALDTPNELPVLARADGAHDANADALLLEPGAWDDDDLTRRYAEIVDAGVECVVGVDDEEQLEQVLELLDPGILLLSADEDANDRVEGDPRPARRVPPPARRVADVGGIGEDAVAGLERVGVDAVIVPVADVAALVGDEPPEV